MPSAIPFNKRNSLSEDALEWGFAFARGTVKAVEIEEDVRKLSIITDSRAGPGTSRSFADLGYEAGKEEFCHSASALARLTNPASPTPPRDGPA